jgi:hypothetical protein
MFLFVATVVQHIQSTASTSHNDIIICNYRELAESKIEKLTDDERNIQRVSSK